MSEDQRNQCVRCGQIIRVEFRAPFGLWLAIAGKEQMHDHMCVACFTEAGDELGYRWDVGLTFWPRPLNGDSERVAEAIAREGNARVGEAMNENLVRDALDRLVLAWDNGISPDPNDWKRLDREIEAALVQARAALTAKTKAAKE